MSPCRAREGRFTEMEYLDQIDRTAGRSELYGQVRLLHGRRQREKEPMEADKITPKALQDCEETLKQLEEENQQLRESSQSFGQLAERLNVTLQAERRTSAADRRQQPRQHGDRRQQTRESTLKLAPHTSDDRSES